VTRSTTKAQYRTMIKQLIKELKFEESSPMHLVSDNWEKI